MRRQVKSAFAGRVHHRSTGDYSGVVDLFVNVDQEKAGLWKGGGIGSHIVTNYGETTFLRGRTLFPTNTAMLEPHANDTHFEVSSLPHPEAGNQGPADGGRINAFDLLAPDRIWVAAASIGS